MEKTLFQFIPIVLIFVFLRYTRDSVALSHTVLGKLFAVSLILFYAKIDAVYGLVICLLVICYYQTDYVEGMKSSDTDNGATDHNLESMDSEKEDEDKNNAESETEEPKKEASEGFTEYAEMYKPAMSQFDQSIVASKNRDFIQAHCDHQSLKYKDQPVRPDNAEHIFTEISFDGAAPCNICSKGCPFMVNRMQQEEGLIRPNLDVK